MCDLCNPEKREAAIERMEHLSNMAKRLEGGFTDMIAGTLRPHAADGPQKQRLDRMRDALHDLAKEFIEDWA